MKKIVITSILSLATYFVTAQKNEEVSESTINDSQLIAWAEQKIDSAMRTNNIPSVSAAIIHNGKLILSKGYGVHNRNNGVQTTKNSIYQIASDTKKMTGIIAKNLANEGTLDLDEPIVTYLGDSLGDNAKKRLAHVTLRLLLNHKSGIPYRQLTKKRKDGDPMLNPYTEVDILNDLNLVELKSKPNEKFSYSNFGYAIAGYVCERASGKTYNQLIEKYISKAYSMPNTTTILSQEQTEQLVTPYRKEDRNGETSAFIMGKLAAAGGVYSTVEDLSKLMLNHINVYNVNSPETSNPLVLHREPSKRENGYGFGLGKKVFDTGIQYGHGGDLDGYASAYLFSPQYQSGVILLTSSGGRWVGELEKQLFYKMTDQTYFPPKKSMAQEIYNLISSTDFEAGKQWFDTHKTNDAYYLKEAEMNNVGYVLMELGKLDDALKVFKLNVSLFPDSANVYDSLAEAYVKTDNRSLAIENYEKSLALNPQNTNAINILKELKSK